MRVRRGAPQHRADACQKFARSEWLHDIVVGADLEQQHFVHLLADRAQDDDGRLHMRGAQLLAKIDAAHLRQSQIRQDQLRLEAERFFETRSPVSRVNGAESFLLQQDADRVAQALIVVDNQNCNHGCTDSKYTKRPHGYGEIPGPFTILLQLTNHCQGSFGQQCKSLVEDSQLTIAAVLALTPLLILPACFFYYDVTPKVAVVLIGARIGLRAFPSRFDAPTRARRLWADPLGRRFCLLTAAQIVSLLLSTCFSSHPALSWNGGNWRRLGFVSQSAVIALDFLSPRRALSPDCAFCFAPSPLPAPLPRFYGILQYFGVDPFLPSAGYHIGEGVDDHRSAAIHARARGLLRRIFALCGFSWARLSWQRNRIRQSAWKALGIAAAVLGSAAIVLSGTRGAAARACRWRTFALDLEPSSAYKAPRGPRCRTLRHEPRVLLLASRVEASRARRNGRSKTCAEAPDSGYGAIRCAWRASACSLALAPRLSDWNSLDTNPWNSRAPIRISIMSRRTTSFWTHWCRRASRDWRSSPDSSRWRGSLLDAPSSTRAAGRAVSGIGADSGLTGRSIRMLHSTGRSLLLLRPSRCWPASQFRTTPARRDRDGHWLVRSQRSPSLSSAVAMFLYFTIRLTTATSPWSKPSAIWTPDASKIP